MTCPGWCADAREDHGTHQSVLHVTFDAGAFFAGVQLEQLPLSPPVIALTTADGLSERIPLKQAAGWARLLSRGSYELAAAVSSLARLAGDGQLPGAVHTHPDQCEGSTLCDGCFEHAARPAGEAVTR